MGCSENAWSWNIHTALKTCQHYRQHLQLHGALGASACNDSCVTTTNDVVEQNTNKKTCQRKAHRHRASIAAVSLVMYYYGP